MRRRREGGHGGEGVREGVIEERTRRSPAPGVPAATPRDGARGALEGVGRRPEGADAGRAVPVCRGIHARRTVRLVTVRGDGATAPLLQAPPLQPIASRVVSCRLSRVS